MAEVLVQDTSLQAIADAIREKNGTETTYKPSEMGTAIRAIESGGSGGIGAVKFVDVDITVEASTTTQVNYTIDNLEFVSSQKVVNGKWKAFARRDIYIACITPKEITGELSGESEKTYNGSLAIMYGNGDYTPCATTIITVKNSGLKVQNNGIYSPVLICNSVKDGKAYGKLTLNVKHASGGLYEVAEGVYNVKVWYVKDFVAEWET